MIILTGHNNMPYLFTHDDNDNLTFIEKMDAAKKKEDTGTMSAMAKFRTMDKKGQGADESSGSSLNTTHQNAIKWVSTMENIRKIILHFSWYLNSDQGPSEYVESG